MPNFLFVQGYKEKYRGGRRGPPAPTGGAGARRPCPGHLERPSERPRRAASSTRARAHRPHPGHLGRPPERPRCAARAQGIPRGRRGGYAAAYSFRSCVQTGHIQLHPGAGARRLCRGLRESCHGTQKRFNRVVKIMTRPISPKTNLYDTLF